MPQNPTFAVHPDPVSGGPCRHQVVRVLRTAPGDRYGGISLDAGRADNAYRSGWRWFEGPKSQAPTARGCRTGSSAPYGRSEEYTGFRTQRRQMAGRMRSKSGTSWVACAQASAVDARPAEPTRPLAFPAGELASEAGSAEFPEEAR
jgi:hypothetical protein